ncbi:SRPBCC family protein [Prochlorococcus marinus]|uniref:SRPBCC family protein n=1 Tax=Prochlorococcus marinus TaxID=1219 RepID=UPI001ADC9BEB|nr:SRPBCC family protein [Prochlorococcus marinus]MBO8204704.1 oligoketide cyclase [Prochlorococcus marinus CUG1415]MBW3043993.1 oligoketide cyclase [Prochlorococcus marinus str. MU1415]
MINSQESVDHSKKNDYRTIEQTMEKLSGGTRRLAAQLTTSASFESLWNVLTDYDRLNLYIPNLLSSKKIYQKDNNVHLKQIGAQDFLGMKFSAEVTIDLFEEKKLGLLKFNLIKGDFRKFEGSWKIQKIKDTSKNSLIYDLTVQGCQWMPIGMIEKRLKKDLSENLIAVDRQAKSSIN